MLTVRSIILSKDRKEGVLLRRSLRGYSFVKTLPKVANIRGAKVCIPSENAVVEDLELPSVKDRSTLDLLIKRQLTSRASLTEEVFLSFITLQSEGETQKVRVFTLPKAEVLSVLSGISLQEVDFIAPTSIALASISKEIDPQKIIFHAFLDAEHLCVCVSKGSEVIYVRSVLIPSQSADVDAYMDSVFENITTTYVFVANRKGIKPDLILVSGRLKELDSVVENIANNTAVGVATPLVPPKFKGLSYQVFHDLLPCLGAVDLPSDYDLTPHGVKENRRFILVAKALIGVLLLTIMGLGWLVYTAYRDLSHKMEALKMQRIKTVAEIVRFTSEYEKVKGELSYYATYINKISEARSSYPFDRIEPFKDLITLLEPKYLKLSSSKNKFTLIIKTQKTFLSVNAMNEFESKLNRIIERAKKIGLKVLVKELDKDVFGKSVSVQLSLEGGL